MFISEFYATSDITQQMFKKDTPMGAAVLCSKIRITHVQCTGVFGSRPRQANRRYGGRAPSLIIGYIHLRRN